MSAVAESKLNVSVSAPVKERLVADANERGSSVNDVAVAILATKYRVKFQGTGRRSPGTHTAAGPLVLRVPTTLYRKVHTAALGRTKSAVVESDLRAHYGLTEATEPALA